MENVQGTRIMIVCVIKIDTYKLMRDCERKRLEVISYGCRRKAKRVKDR